MYFTDYSICVSFLIFYPDEITFYWKPDNMSSCKISLQTPLKKNWAQKFIFFVEIADFLQIREFWTLFWIILIISALWVQKWIFEPNFSWAMFILWYSSQINRFRVKFQKQILKIFAKKNFSKKKFKPEIKKIQFFFRIFQKKLYGHLFHRKWDNFWVKNFELFFEKFCPRAKFNFARKIFARFYSLGFSPQ